MPLVVRVPSVTSRAPAEPGESAEPPRSGHPDRAKWLNVLDPRKSAVQRELRRHGLSGYEPQTQATILGLMSDCPDEGAFLDVGAHIGLYSALVAVTCPSPATRIVAIEPTPQTAALARKLARVNGLDIEVVQVALSDRSGDARLYLSDKAETSNSLNAQFRDHAEDVVVTTTTLDLLSEELTLVPHLIKIDVETHEGEALNGAMGTIEAHRPWIVVEILEASAGGWLIPALDRVEGLGYTLYPLVPEMDWVPGHPRHGTRAAEGYRDWLLAPTPMNTTTASRIEEWRTAISQCTQDTNALVPRGSTFARGWNSKDAWTIS